MSFGAASSPLVKQAQNTTEKVDPEVKEEESTRMFFDLREIQDKRQKQS
jgi:hypothetical protein